MKRGISEKRDVVRKSADILPRTGGDDAVDELTAQAFIHDLQQSGSKIPSQLQAHISGLVTAAEVVLEQVPDHSSTYVVTDTELRGIVARALNKGAAIAGLEIASAQLQAQSLEQAFHASDSDHGSAA